MNSFQLPDFEINPISERDGWRLCDFCCANENYLSRFFPSTLASNLNPTLSKLFVERKVSEFIKHEEYLFTLKEPQNRKIIGLVYVKAIDLAKNEAELAYCIDYNQANKGYTTIAVETISKWALQLPNINTLRILVHKTNIGSTRVAEKCGYLWKETLKKSFTPPNEEPLDMELYVLKNER